MEKNNIDIETAHLYGGKSNNVHDTNGVIEDTIRETLYVATTEDTLGDETRSDEVHEILTHVPNWLIRWGSTMFLGVLGILLLIAWVVKYPDIISGQLTLTTTIPPVKLVSKVDGVVQKLYVKNHELVNKGDFIAQIENPLDKQTVEALKKAVDVIGDDELWRNDSLALQNKDYLLGQLQLEAVSLGEMQQDYNNMLNALKEYFVLKSNLFKNEKVNQLKTQIKNYQNLITINIRELTYINKSLENSKERFRLDKRLLARKAISKVDFFSREEKYTQALLQKENLEKLKIQNKISVTRLQTQLIDFTQQFDEKIRAYESQVKGNLKNIRNHIQNWQKNYVLTAPFDGEISFLNQLNESQFVRAGSQLFAVIPSNNTYVAQVLIPANGFGKVKLDQRALLKLNNFPYQEYGQLEGVVTQLSEIPFYDTANKVYTYSAQVALTNGLQSTYKKNLSFKPEMTGVVDIVTKDYRFVERIFNQFRKIFDK